MTGDPATAVELGGYTTLRLGGPASAWVTATSEEELVDAVARRDRAGEPVLVLGGGSNLVVGDTGYPGTVVQVATRGITELARDDAEATLEVAAGEDWDRFVARTVQAGYGGLECLSGIPGQVGATPIQNVGAYGWDISQVLRWVRLYDRRAATTRTAWPEELGLGYRTSDLKGTDAALVLRVGLALHADGYSLPVRYPELARTLGVQLGTRVPVADARAAVLDLRGRKGMVLDPADRDTWSAGSFFTNPIIGPDELEGVLARVAAVTGAADELPQFPAETGVKLSAAWLIERAGFARGYPGPASPARLSGKHTLALCNHEDATTEELLALAREIRDGVAERFGVLLRPEPLLVNCAL